MKDSNLVREILTDEGVGIVDMEGMGLKYRGRYHRSFISLDEEQDNSDISSSPPSGIVSSAGRKPGVFALVVAVITEAFFQLATQAAIGIDLCWGRSAPASDRPGRSIHVRNLTLHAITSAVSFLHIKADHGLAGLLVK